MTPRSDAVFVMSYYGEGPRSRDYLPRALTGLMRQSEPPAGDEADLPVSLEKDDPPGRLRQGRRHRDWAWAPAPSGVPDLWVRFLQCLTVTVWREEQPELADVVLGAATAWNAKVAAP